MTSPQDKFARNWLEAKPEMILNYNLNASYLAQKIRDSKPKLITNWNQSIESGKWESGLKKYVGNDKMANAYKEGVNAKTEILPHEKQKVVDYVILERTLIFIVNVITQNRDRNWIEFYHPRDLSFPKVEKMLSMMAVNYLIPTQYRDYSRPVFDFLQMEYNKYVSREYDWISYKNRNTRSLKRFRGFRVTIDENNPTYQPIYQQN